MEIIKPLLHTVQWMRVDPGLTHVSLGGGAYQLERSINNSL